MSTPYHIRIAPAAERAILALPHKQQKTIVQFITALSVNPRPPGAIKIEGMIGLYSDTIENSRIVYKIENPDVFILLVK